MTVYRGQRGSRGLVHNLWITPWVVDNSVYNRIGVLVTLMALVSGDTMR